MHLLIFVHKYTAAKSNSLLVSRVFEVPPSGGGELAGGGGRLLPGEVQSKLVIVDLTISILVTPAGGCELVLSQVPFPLFSIIVL